VNPYRPWRIAFFVVTLLAILCVITVVCLAGIGFTMSLFIAMLAFADSPLVDTAKRGIVVGSLLAGVAGALLLKMSPVLRDDQ